VLKQDRALRLIDVRREAARESFVQGILDGQFVAEHKKSPATKLAIHGQEKVGDTLKLCRMNLAVHGLEDDIREGISYYDDPHDATGRLDFPIAFTPCPIFVRAASNPATSSLRSPAVARASPWDVPSWLLRSFSRCSATIPSSAIDLIPTGLDRREVSSLY